MVVGGSTKSTVVFQAHLDQFLRIMRSASGQELRAWSTRTATRAFGWAITIEREQGELTEQLCEKVLRECMSRKRKAGEGFPFLLAHLGTDFDAREAKRFLGSCSSVLVSTMLNSFYLSENEELVPWLEKECEKMGKTDLIRKENLERLHKLKQDILDKMEKEPKVRQVLEASMVLSELRASSEYREGWEQRLKAGSLQQDRLKQVQLFAAAILQAYKKTTTDTVSSEEDDDTTVFCEWGVDMLITHCNPTLWSLEEELLLDLSKHSFQFALKYISCLIISCNAKIKVSSMMTTMKRRDESHEEAFTKELEHPFHAFCDKAPWMRRFCLDVLSLAEKEAKKVPFFTSLRCKLINSSQR